VATQVFSTHAPDFSEIAPQPPKAQRTNAIPGSSRIASYARIALRRGTQPPQLATLSPCHTTTSVSANAARLVMHAALPPDTATSVKAPFHSRPVAHRNMASLWTRKVGYELRRFVTGWLMLPCPAAAGNTPAVTPSLSPSDRFVRARDRDLERHDCEICDARWNGATNGIGYS